MDFGVKVKCFFNGKFCGRCCHETEMPLTEEDVRRISDLGYDPKEFAVKVDGVYRLRNVNGKCYFLDEQNRCRIYEHRPIGCRIYPVVLDVERGKAVLDDECPMGWTVSEEDFKRAEAVLRELVKRLYRKRPQL